MRVVVKIPRGVNKPREVTCTDLVSDCWTEYLHYLKEAKVADKSGKKLERNRAMRAALLNLIAHFEGVISELIRFAKKEHPKFVLRQTADRRDPCFLHKALDLRSYAERHLNLKLPYLRMRLKSLRDILVHPNIIKIDPDRRDGRKLSQHDLYSWKLADFERDGRYLESWLERLCHAFGHKRVRDTRAIVESFAKKLGTVISMEPI